MQFAVNAPQKGFYDKCAGAPRKGLYDKYAGAPRKGFYGSIRSFKNPVPISTARYEKFIAENSAR